MPFCSKDLSILNDVPTLKTMPAGEIEITRDDFGAIVIFFIKKYILIKAQIWITFASYNTDRNCYIWVFFKF